MDFSCLNDIPTFYDRPKNHKNIPYPNLQIISGKSGSGKTHILLLKSLTPDILDYEELYVLSPNIHQKEYQFLKIGFDKHIDKSVLLNFFPRLNRFRINQLDEVFEIIDNNLASDLKQNNIRTVFTSKKEDLPTIKEMNDDTENFLYLMTFLEIENIVKIYIGFLVKVDQIIVKQFILHNNLVKFNQKV